MGGSRAPRGDGAIAGDTRTKQSDGDQHRSTRAGFEHRRLYRLLAAYSEHPVTWSLVVAKPGPARGNGLLPPEVEAVIAQAIDDTYLQRERPALERLRREIWTRCKKADLKPPSRKAISARISSRNTGDGIRMAADVGAELWHMWHFHGSYGFRHPDSNYPFAIRMKRLPDWTPEVRPATVQMAWIQVDRNGRRFCNEYKSYIQDTGHRVLDAFDPVNMRFPYNPCFAVMDDDGRQLYPLGSPVSNDGAIEPYVWSPDNNKEVQNGLLKRAETVAELAVILGCPEEQLHATLDHWNDGCVRQHDADFARSAATMVREKSRPSWWGKSGRWCSTRRAARYANVRQQVLNPYGEPIPRLYEAGELGSI